MAVYIEDNIIINYKEYSFRIVAFAGSMECNMLKLNHDKINSYCASLSAT